MLTQDENLVDLNIAVQYRRAAASTFRSTYVTRRIRSVK